MIWSAIHDGTFCENSLSVIMASLTTGVSGKQSTPNFPKYEHLLPPDMHTRVSVGKKCLFFGKFGVLCFLEIPVLRLTHLPY